MPIDNGCLPSTAVITAAPRAVSRRAPGTAVLRGLALLLTLLRSARSVAADPRVLRGPTMGTTYVITFPQRHGAQGSASLKHSIGAVLEEIYYFAGGMSAGAGCEEEVFQQKLVRADPG